MKLPHALFALIAVLFVLADRAPAAPAPLPGERVAEVASAPVFGVAEITFAGPVSKPSDQPAKEIEFNVLFRHESGSPEYRVHGFWDGDGAGGSSGGVFKVRFCPTAIGRWTLAEVHSNVPQLRGQNQGQYVTGTASSFKGFWVPDDESPGRRWLRRSDGSHAFIFGNTHYSFLSEMTDRGERPGSIAADVAAGAPFFNKLRFSLHPCRYSNPMARPFFDSAGQPTDDGASSHRPNPAWFNRRADVAVRAAFEADVIADLILNGPDTPDARSVLKAGGNSGDPAPFLRYVAARYGSYPNVWMCLSNEWDIKMPRYTAQEIIRAGRTLRKFLPYPTPVSVHGNTGDWEETLNTDPPWNTHAIVQNKIRTLEGSADFMQRSWQTGGSRMPVINDELGYEGEGDKFLRDDVIEGHLGAFIGGGYGSTGFKPANKKGHYFWGAFNPAEHTAAPHLKWLRERISRNVTFWKMAPVPLEPVFKNAPKSARAMAWEGRELVLATNVKTSDIVANLPAGVWSVRRFDAVAMQEDDLAARAEGAVRFDAPDSRAVLFHFKQVLPR